MFESLYSLLCAWSAANVPLAALAYVFPARWSEFTPISKGEKA